MREVHNPINSGKMNDQDASDQRLDKCWWEPLIEVYCVFEPLESATIELEKNLIILTPKKPSKSRVKKKCTTNKYGAI